MAAAGGPAQLSVAALPVRHQMSRMSDKPAETVAEPSQPPARPAPPQLPKEIGGPPGPEPTRHGDWEHKGRCTDF
jgi:hypothetical protein